MWQQTTKLLQVFLNYIFPSPCLGCRQTGAILCGHCISQFERVLPPFCDFCGLPIQLPNKWHNCSLIETKLSQVCTPFFYTSLLKKIVYDFKYNGFFGGADPLAYLMFQYWPGWQKNPDLIIPIPMHPTRQKERGYNQSELLAKKISTLVSIPINTSTLSRIRNTRPQVGLNASERLINVSGAFHAHSQEIQGKHVLLIDDIYTTGATLISAAEALIGAGASTVFGYCLAQATTYPNNL